MRRNSLEFFMFLLTLIVSRRRASSTSGRDNLFHENDPVSSSKPNESPLAVIPPIDYADTARSCLYVSPDLPPCHFNRDDNIQRFRRSLDESYEGVKLKRKFPFEERVMVYALQGCLPSRLPFKMALCESKESLERATRIWKLYPFQATGDRTKASFVFPRFDLDRWTREMKLHEGVERGRKKEEKTAGGKDDPENSSVSSREYFPASILTSLDHMGEDGSTVSSVLRNNPRRSSSNERRRRRRGSRRRRRWNERPQGSSRDRHEIEGGSKFPYSKSIPFDSKILGIAERSSKFLRTSHPLLLSRRTRDIEVGNEFSYWKAIPYDSKKLGFGGTVSGDHRVRKLRNRF